MNPLVEKLVWKLQKASKQGSVKKTGQMIAKAYEDLDQQIRKLGLPWYKVFKAYQNRGMFTICPLGEGFWKAVTAIPGTPTYYFLGDMSWLLQQFQYRSKAKISRVVGIEKHLEEKEIDRPHLGLKLIQADFSQAAQLSPLISAGAVLVLPWVPAEGHGSLFDVSLLEQRPDIEYLVYIGRTNVVFSGGEKLWTELETNWKIIPGSISRDWEFPGPDYPDDPCYQLSCVFQRRASAARVTE